jgi:hypothetical protein
VVGAPTIMGRGHICRWPKTPRRHDASRTSRKVMWSRSRKSADYIIVTSVALPDASDFAPHSLASPYARPSFARIRTGQQRLFRRGENMALDPRNRRSRSVSRKPGAPASSCPRPKPAPPAPELANKPSASRASSQQTPRRSWARDRPRCSSAVHPRTSAIRAGSDPVQQSGLLFFDFAKGMDVEVDHIAIQAGRSVVRLKAFHPNALGIVVHRLLTSRRIAGIPA